MSRIIPAISESEPALNPAEACEFLGGVTRQTLDNYKRLGRSGRRLLAHKIGGRVYFLASQLREFTAPEDAKQPATASPHRGRHGAKRTDAATLDGLRRQGFKI